MIPNELRLWPGVLLVLLGWALSWSLAWFPDLGLYGVLGSFLCHLLVIVWWVLFSRAAWIERLTAPLLIVVGVPITYQFIDVSIRTAGQGLSFYFNVLPWLSTALVAWAVVTRKQTDTMRRATMVATIVLVLLAWLPLRIDGVMGGFSSQWNWRWAETAEERLLARAEAVPSVVDSSAAAADLDAGLEAAWPGFRGAGRDSVVRGTRIGTDWAASPPVELWRRAVGPGIGSFAVLGDLLYTQEQRGEEEVVAAYRIADGEPVWMHRDAARFWDSHAGPGPRGTPSVSRGRVVTLGGTGLVNMLDAATGAVVWSRDAVAETEATLPPWGIASSPLVVGDLVIVAVESALAAYDFDTGEPRWFAPRSGGTYGSPHLMTIDGVQQVLIVSGGRTRSFAPGDGRLLWEHASDTGSIVQPAMTGDGDLLISTISELPQGMERISVDRDADGWNVEEVWQTHRLKPYFNDFVVHEGHVYGFDNSILASIDAATGERNWKGGRYGHGQLLLLADVDLLLVLTETGELALVRAAPKGYEELALFPALDSKSWNHPVLVGDLLLVRNDREMAAFRLPPAGS